jgi:hypothetical protein
MGGMSAKGRIPDHDLQNAGAIRWRAFMQACPYLTPGQFDRLSDAPGVAAQAAGLAGASVLVSSQVAAELA